MLAAGGIVSGAHVAACLTLGAAGVVVGTRFCFTPESLYSDQHKRALISAGPTSTMRSMAFDQLRSQVWPAGIDGRGLDIPAVRDVEAGADIAEARKKLAEGVRRGDAHSTIVWAGTGVGLVSELKPAAVGHRNSACVGTHS